MIPNDHLFGSFEFETEINRDGDEYVASALGLSARHSDQWQALNDLNQKLEEAISKGELIPDQG